MKKTLSGLLTIAVMLFCAVSAFAANDSTVSIKNDSQTFAHGYDSTTKTEAAVSITKLLNKLEGIKGDGTPVTQVLTIKNKIGSDVATDIGLKLLDTTIYQNDADASKSVLNNYNIVVTDPSGEVVAKSADEDIYKNEAGIFVLYLPLGTFNEEFSTETKVYNIEFSLDADDSNITSIVDWNIVCMPQNGNGAISGAIVPSAVPSATEAPRVTPSASTETNDKTLTKYVGANKDIAPGKYTITGNGAVKVYNSKDDLKTSIILTDGKDPSKKGVEAYSLSLNEGDRIEMADYINLKAITAASAQTNNTTTKNPAATTKPAANKKTNPKTSDTAPIAIISLVAIASLGVCAYLEIKKRKTE